MPSIRSLPLSSVKSLSATEAAALKRIGIDNTKELLEAASSTSAERALAKKAGLPTSVVREAVNRADLLNVKGVGKSTADLFENVGVNSAKELAQRNPVALARSLEAFVKSHPDQGRWLPSAATITTLVENAKPFATPPGPQPAPVKSWGEAQGRAVSALFKHIDEVLFSNHPDGAAFREAILAHRPQSEWPQVRAQLRAGVANFANGVPPPSGGAPSGATRTETPTHYTWEGALLGLYTELQVSKATGSIDKLYLEID
jgi:predicted flap endonuclease-1-like 5' DNA nuclease